MDFVDNVDLIAGRGRAVVYAFDDFSDIIHAGAAGGVHFHNIDVTPLHDSDTVFAFPAGIGCWAACPVRPDAIHTFGDDTRGRGFSRPPNAGHDKGLGDPIRFKCISQCAHHRILPHKIRKSFGAVFAGKDLVTCCVL